MATKRMTVSVRLEKGARQRVEKAAKLMKQSSGAFLEKAGLEHARSVLAEWAVARYHRGDATFSELAQETGLSVEEIMAAAGDEGKDEAIEMFLASCRTAAETIGDPSFLQIGRKVAKAPLARR